MIIAYAWPMNTNLAVTIPPENLQRYVTTLGRAAADLARARDSASEAIAASRKTGLDTAFGYAYKAVSQLHASFVLEPAAGSASAARRAIEDANEGISELRRALDQRAVSFNVVRDSWNDSIADIGRAQNLAKHPPSTDVGDGS